METVKVNKKELIDTLTKNMASYIEKHQEASSFGLKRYTTTSKGTQQ